MFLTHLTLTVLATLTAGAAYLSPHLLKQLQVRRLRELCRRTRILVLTYDDGPGLELTPGLLSLLASAGVRATFFPTGASARRQSTLLSQVQTAGHEIGCHGRSHLHAWKTLPWKAAADVSGGFRALRDWVSTDSLFRPPYGKVTLATWLSVRCRGVRMGWWTVDSGDTWESTPDPSNVVNRVELDGGGVVLMHDFDRSGPDASRRADYVLQVTQRLLDLAKRRGLTVCTLSDLLNRSRLPQKKLRQRPISVLAISSGGGHWVQLMRLRPALDGHDVTYVTVDPAYQDDVRGAKFRTVCDATRWNRLRLLYTGAQVLWILLRVRPQVVISTGAAPGFFAVRFGRLLGSRTVWVDSIANVEKVSMSGEIALRHVDLFLTQWEHLALPQGPQFAGAVI